MAGSVVADIILIIVFCEINIVCVYDDCVLPILYGFISCLAAVLTIFDKIVPSWPACSWSTCQLLNVIFRENRLGLRLWCYLFLIILQRFAIMLINVRHDGSNLEIIWFNDNLTIFMDIIYFYCKCYVRIVVNKHPKNVCIWNFSITAEVYV